MYEFLEYVLSEFKNSLGLVLLAGTGALALLSVTYILHKKKYKVERKYPWGKAILWAVFAGYISVVVYATILRGVGGFREWNLHLFRAWREAWNNYTAKNWANVLLNVAMFCPMGFLLPLLGRKFRKWYLTILTGFGSSLVIELLQLATGRGICDVDDLFANTLGTAIGFFLILTILSLTGQKGNRLKPGIAYGVMFLACTASIGSIFLAYELKEFGNLPMAPAYTNDTGSTEWVLDCELPAAEDLIPIYRTQTRSLEDCDAFAAQFKEIIQTEYTSVLYYQEAAYYMDQSGDDNGAHFLFLSYMDPSYEYCCSMGDDPVWASADRETVKNALAKYPCLIPEYARFEIQNAGWHVFTVDQYVDGAMMVDGELRCRISEDGTVREIHNNLLSYTWYDSVSIFSPEEAYRRLRAGQFNDGGYFESKSPELVRVVSCELGYEIDTKGFYQPVYLFKAEAADGSYADTILIPAIK